MAPTGRASILMYPNGPGRAVPKFCQAGLAIFGLYRALLARCHITRQCCSVAPASTLWNSLIIIIISYHLSMFYVTCTDICNKNDNKTSTSKNTEQYGTHKKKRKFRTFTLLSEVLSVLFAVCHKAVWMTATAKLGVRMPLSSLSYQRCSRIENICCCCY